MSNADKKPLKIFYLIEQKKKISHQMRRNINHSVVRTISTYKI